jgi:hypothetical protein
MHVRRLLFWIGNFDPFSLMTCLILPHMICFFLFTLLACFYCFFFFLKKKKTISRLLFVREIRDFSHNKVKGLLSTVFHPSIHILNRRQSHGYLTSISSGNLGQDGYSNLCNRKIEQRRKESRAVSY